MDAIAINAGVGVGGDTKTDLQEELNLIELNAASTVRPAKRVVKDMVERGKGTHSLHVIDRLPDAQPIPSSLRGIQSIRSLAINKQLTNSAEFSIRLQGGDGTPLKNRNRFQSI